MTTPALPPPAYLAGSEPSSDAAQARMVRRLFDENRELREELQATVVRQVPEPEPGHPGHEVWRALMEDARERGEVRLTVRHQQFVTVEWEVAVDA